MDELTTAAGEERTAGEEPGTDAPETPGASGVAPEREHRSATVEYPAEVVDPLAPVKPVINYHISDFDGPLDLLVELIGKARIWIL